MKRAAYLILSCAVACGGVGPAPEEIAATMPAASVLDDGQRRQVEAHTATALDSLGREDYLAARRSAEAALALDARAARARAVLGRCLMASAQAESPPTLALWQQAEGELRLADRLWPRDPEIATLRAQFFEADGHLSAAAGVLDNALDDHPLHPGCLREAGRLHYELGEERAALPLMLRLLELQPLDPTVLYRVAQAQLRLASTSLHEPRDGVDPAAEFATAAASFRRYRQAVPVDAEGYSGEAFARTEILRLQAEEVEPRQLAEVLELYGEAARLMPMSPEPDFNYGVVQEEIAGDAAAARAAYERALARDPEHLPSLLNMAANLAADDRADEAVPFCRRALLLPLPEKERDRIREFVAGREQG